MAVEIDGNEVPLAARLSAKFWIYELPVEERAVGKKRMEKNNCREFWIRFGWERAVG
jgi:hypothetical protein